MKMLRGVTALAVLLGFSLALADVGPKWPTDKYKAFALAKKKGKLLFLYYTSTS